MQEMPTGLQRSHSYLYCHSSYEMSSHRKGSYVIDIEQTENKKAFYVQKICAFEFIIAFGIIRMCLCECMHACTSTV